ncbi:NAD-glutamate dehydrogenase [Iamia sp. SCSIO 61187]|uniref:NAD-glutamate dehydrogenase domain-containing protein n=1 Tax=Iamia sp. SCSIO 61187 TaxID=2722752 RepID=UPI001C637D26|nr:NAD-glutamate dehydrogenase domain-containing protein [Iamia sp. SCSIO 61187]QYG93667.1 NAD-glutamate dehydrogenase [Iamia sp. SCSIO 61187]
MTAPPAVRDGFEAAVARRRQGVPPSDEAVDAALALAMEHQDPWTVRVRPPGVDLLAGHQARGSVVEIAGDDRPLIVTSVEEELRAAGQRALDIVPMAYGAERDAAGALVGVGPARGAAHTEALIQIELVADLDDGTAAALSARLQVTLGLLRAVTADHAAIRDRLLETALSLDALMERGAADGANRVAVADAARTVRWLLEGNALLLGLGRRGPGVALDGPAADGEHDLGLLRCDPRVAGRAGTPAPVGPEEPIRVVRLSALSPLHRRVPMLRLDLWAPDADGGGGTAEHLLWVVARRAAGAPLASVPLLRRKLDALLEREDVVPGSYDEQHVTLLFQSLPEDDLFGLDTDSLHALVGELLTEDRDHSVRVVLRPVVGSHAVAALVTVPVDRWNRGLRQRLERFLLAQLDGERVDVALSIGGGSSAVTARMVVHVEAGRPVPDQLDAVAREVRLVCRSWEEQLAGALAASPAADELGDPAVVAARWADRLPEAFRDTVVPRDAVDDVVALERQAGAKGAPPRVTVWFGARRATDDPERLCLVVDHDLELSRLLPAIESLGLWVTDEARWPVGDDLFVHHLGVRVRAVAGEGRPRPLVEKATAARLGAAVAALVTGPAEVDGLNRLVLHAELDWPDVAVLRAYRRYRHQVAPQDDEAYVDEVLVGHPQIARALVALWRARFGADPDADADPESGGRAARAAAASKAVHRLCDGLARLDHDRILRGLAGTIDATLRANHELRPEGPLALKLDPSLVPGCPDPRPHREVFVSGRDVEGVHLRAGPVARGGLRASDRDQDYRSEVLDLMRAQVLKNAVIVPTGAKGGFVLRGEAAATVGDDRRGRVAAAYDQFVGALLDVTDDLDGDRVVPVPGRWDGDDPYLVVAADKGTATFSDRANALAEARGFWLGDAFASGGSKGYDHKALGITARGAWVAIARHLRALGLDAHRDEITMAGVGDMSGDVFGNGLLHSDKLRLIAAFDHRHVFLDPDPDPEASHAERRRLFELPGSSWADYDPDLISAGGGVHPRTAKAVPLTPEVKTALRVDDEELTPAALVRAVLCAPVDLLYFGGIGTYVRASTEDDARVDDRANAEVRVVGRDLRARVVGEGANLALTQRARIEIARRGARVNVDAIDNAAGVDCSDHEVNLKILLARAATLGRIDRDERDALLVEHVDDVVDAVLSDCAAQSEALDRAERTTPEGLDATIAVLRHLVAEGVLDPEVEALPDDGELAARAAAGAGFTRPELAVLLAGVKRRVAGELLASAAPDHPVLRDALVDYFPPGLRERFDDILDDHRLRRELIAAEVANDLVDHLGLTAVVTLAAEVGASVPETALAYWVARGILRSPDRWRTLSRHRGATLPDLDPDPVDGGDLLADLLHDMTRTELLRAQRERRQGRTWDPIARIEEDRPVADALVQHMGEAADPERGRERRRLAVRLAAGGLAPEVADGAALVPELEVVHDVAAVARDLGREPVAVAAAFRAVARRLGLDDLRRMAATADVSGPWAGAARQGLLDDLVGIRREAARRALQTAPDAVDPAVAVDRYLAANPAAVSEADAVRRRLVSDDGGGLDGLAVAVRAARRAAL